MKKELSIFYLLLIVVCCLAEPKMEACIDNYELSFFCDAKQFYDSKKICEDRRSYLVKIDNANMTEIIKDVIDKINCSYREDYHGGATADNNRQWTWLDGSRVYLQNEGGYQNWRDGQPNDSGGREDCMKLDKYTIEWIDSPCAGIVNTNQPTEQRYYICQKNLTLNVDITELSYDTLKCSATSGFCVNQVEWRRNNETVSTSQSHSVYQELSIGTSVLHYEKATINDSGEYSCKTWVLQNEANRVSSSKNVKVDGTPSINKTTSSPCNTSLMIFWNPNPSAIGFLHKIKVNYSTTVKQVKYIAETPTENVLQVTQIIGLQPYSAYHIQITACEDEITCTDGHTVNATATTGGIVIDNATMWSDNDTCIVTWNRLFDTSTDFKLSINPSFGVNVSKVNRPVNYTDNKISYSFEMQPEQVYGVQIQASGSESVCPEPVYVGGTCKGRDIPTTTISTTTQELVFTTESNQNRPLSGITMIVIPVSLGVFVILIIVGIVVCCKRHKNQDVQILRGNTIHGVINNAASESTFDHLHSSSENQKSNNSKSTRKLSQPSLEVVFNPLYGDIGMEMSPENQEIYVEANAEYNDAPVYAAISKPKKEIRNKVCSSEEHDSKSPPFAAQQDDDVYAVVDKRKN